MGKRGPKPKPTAAKQLEGTYRPDRAPKNEAKPKRPRKIKVPDSIKEDEIAKDAWQLYAPKLHRNGLFTELDSPALEGFCLAYSRAVRADAEIRKRGLIIYGDSGPRKNPAESISRTSWAEARRFLSLFGMSPSDRTRVEADPVADDGVEASNSDPTENFLFPAKVAGHIGPR